MVATLLSFFVCTLCLVDEPITPKIETPKQLEAMSFLIGKWVGEGEMPGVGKYTDEFIYKWNDSKTFIKVDYKMMTGAKVAWSDKTVIGYDPDLKKTVGFTFGMDGSIGRAVTVQSTEKEWHIEGKSVGQTPFKEWKMIMKKIDDNTLEMVMETKKGDKYEPMMTSKYKKIPDKK